MRITSNAGIRGLTRGAGGQYFIRGIFYFIAGRFAALTVCMSYDVCSQIFFCFAIWAPNAWDGCLSVYRVHALTRTIQLRQVTTWEPTLVERGMPSLKIILSFILKVNKDRFFMVPRIPLLNHWMKEKGNIGHLFSNFHQIIWLLLRKELSVLASYGDRFSIFEKVVVSNKWLLRLFILT